MARSKLSICLFAFGALFAVTPALAQFGSIFRDGPPRPPANVPSEEPDDDDQPLYYPDRRGPPPQQLPSYPGQAYPRQAPPPPYYPSQAERPQPQPAPVNPPVGGPNGGAIQTQELAPPPGTAPPPEAAQDAPPASAPGQPQPNQSQEGIVRTTPGLPPGVRQPSGQPQQADAPPPTQEVVVAPPPMRIPNPTAVFSGLDKITGRIISFDVAINETVQFGALQVTPRVCYSRPPTETPNTDAFVEVDEVTLQGEIKRIFTGWMFAASPGLHAVEHPVYDVWLTDCKGAQNPAVAETSSNQQNAAHKPPALAPKKRVARPPSPRGSLPPLR